MLRESRLAWEAHAIANDALSGVPDIMRSYEPLADLLIKFEMRGASAGVSQAGLDKADGMGVRAELQY